MARILIALLLGLAGITAQAQQTQPANGLFLIAKPSLIDPNFQKTVVLVTQTEDASTVGVVINRPSALKLSEILSPEIPTQNYKQPVFVGGPVLQQIIIAVYRSDAVPAAPAFHVLKDVYLTMHPDNLQKLLADPKARYRLYAGFSGWAPRQLESEFMRDGWYVLPADDATLFRDSTEGLWEELVERAMRRDPKGRS
ncbi:MAG TPA: YqgE/AlgH family protein [Burkholderiales bacterium]